MRQEVNEDVRKEIALFEWANILALYLKLLTEVFEVTLVEKVNGEGSLRLITVHLGTVFGGKGICGLLHLPGGLRGTPRFYPRFLL